MAEILVSGYYGFYNAGDEAILGGMIRSIHDLDPSVRFTVISGKAAYTRAVHKVEAVSRGDFRKIWAAAGRADLVISGGGSLLQDVTSAKSIPYYLGIITMGKLHRKPVMFYAQGVGPVTGVVGRSLIPLVANRVDRITVRDEESAQTMGRLRVSRPPITVTADPALALGPSDPDWGATFLREAGVNLSRPLIGVSVRPWQTARPWEPALASSLDQLAKETGAQIVFLPMQQVKDGAAAAGVIGRMTTPAIAVQGDHTYVHTMAMMACCDLVIGMRYHALVFAAMNNVPLVGLSYDPKNDSFLRLIGEQAAATTEDLQADAVLTAARRALTDSAAIKERLRRKMAELTPRSRQNAQLALELLQERGR